MRVISGAYKGRRLKVGNNNKLRPTSGRARAAVFDILAFDLADLAVLDLYAGTGAMGIEALSRGAERAVFVDAGRDSFRLLKDNLKALGLDDRTLLMNKRAGPALKLLAAEERRFGLVFIDPPYKSREADKIMRLLSELDVLDPGATVVCENEDPGELSEKYNTLILTDRRQYGRTVVSFYEKGDADP
jgi:16S rRNA (guanine(966)-N(2))-methyltransferase RsmD